MKPFISSLTPRGLLSFAPDAAPIALGSLNLIIGPNGSGKSNLVEILELLRAAPQDISSAIRDGGGVNEWIWKGKAAAPPVGGSLEVLCDVPIARSDVRYRVAFNSVNEKIEIVDEVLEETVRRNAYDKDVYFFYRFQDGHPAINVRQSDGNVERRQLSRETLMTQQSVMSQRRDADFYPELTFLARQFAAIGIFREWSFGRYTPLRQPQPADLPSDQLLPDARNLGLVISSIEHSDVWPAFLAALRRFLPRFKNISTRVQANTVQVFVHEDGLRLPIPATRLSDGTIRFIVLLAILLRPEAMPLICIEEPELGLHPDAVSQLGDLIVEASEKTQIIVTTQSDVLVSRLTDRVESVLVADNIAGSTTLTRLSQDSLKGWLDDYQLGEVWRMGEIGGNP